MGNGCCAKRDKTSDVPVQEIGPQELELLNMVDKKYISDCSTQKESFLQALFSSIEAQFLTQQENSLVCLQIEKKKVKTFIGQLYQILRKIKELSGTTYVITHLQSIKVSVAAITTEVSQDTTIDEGFVEDEVLVILREAHKQSKVRVDAYIDEQQAAKQVVIKSLTLASASAEDNQQQILDFLKIEKNCSLLGGYQSKGKQNQLELVLMRNQTPPSVELTIEVLPQGQTSASDLETVINQAQIDESRSFNNIIPYEDTYQKVWFCIYQKSESDKAFTVSALSNDQLAFQRLRRSVNGSLSSIRTSADPTQSKADDSKPQLLSEYIQSEERKHSCTLVEAVFPTADLSLLVFTQ